MFLNRLRTVICAVCIYVFALIMHACEYQRASAIDGIFKDFNKKNGPGCAVGVVQNGKLVFSKGYGMANLEYDVPIGRETVFDIASVSKQFTGLAISTLIEEGKIKLDDDVHQYVPEVPDFGKKITVGHLVHHTSGLRDWPEALHIAGWRWDEVFSFEDVMRMLQHQKALDFEPGEQFLYSNTGYTLLARIVENVSGKKFAAWTHTQIFQPLDMENSHFQDDYTKPVEQLAAPYEPGEGGYRKISGALTAYGSSSLFTTVEDLAKWAIHFEKQITAKNPVYLRMLSPGKLNNGERVGYAFGLSPDEDRGIATVSHTGGWAGYRTILVNYPSERLSIIILSNAADFSVTPKAMQVADLYLGDKLRAKAASAKIIDWKDKPTVQLDPALARKFTGIYQLGEGWTVDVTEEHGKIMVQASGEPRFPTEAKADSVVWIEAYGAAITFVSEKSGMVNLLRYKDVNAPRITPVAPDAASMPLFAGTYYSP